MTSNVGHVLEDTLRNIADKRKKTTASGPYEDVMWTRPMWLDLWRELKAQGGCAGEPDDKQPIIVKTALFTLRIHAQPVHAAPQLVQ